MSPHCIVIGASAGGLEPLREVIAQLPADLPAPLFVVMHLPANQQASRFQRSAVGQRQTLEKTSDSETDD